jgi:hypothetical protein
MSKWTVYKCDKCGNEAHTGTQFWTVGVAAFCESNSQQYAIGRLDFVDQKSMQVCRPCLELLGIHVSQKTLEKLTYEPPTLEELIREIVQKELESSLRSHERP